jgi:hypothetical protein
MRPQRPRHHVRPGEGLVSERGIEIADAVLLAERERSPGVVKRGFRSAQDRIDAGDLPFAADLVHGLADAEPVIEGRVCGVQHQLVLIGGPRRLLQQAPNEVERALGELALGLLVERGVVVGDRHRSDQSMTARTWPVSTT